jgi:tRNA(Ile)-lysidine synthase
VTADTPVPAALPLVPLLARVAPQLGDLLGRPRWWLGFSGGLDSTVLLCLLVDYLALQEASTRPELIAVHVNHGLSSRADEWQQYCEAVCATLAVRCHSASVVVDTGRRGGLEAAARRARYAVFAAVQQRSDVLLLAHHRDDQIETVLLKLFRSSGIEGLAGMRERVVINGRLRVRPLLASGRDELLQYAQHRGLRWIEDESNRDQRLSRNFVRHRVLPLLTEHWPQCRRQLLSLSRSAADSVILLQEIADQDLLAVANDDRWGQKLELAVLLEYSRPRIRNAVTRWLHRHGVPSLRQRQWGGFFDQLLAASGDRIPSLALPGGCLMRYQGALYWVPDAQFITGSSRAPVSLTAAQDWDLQVPLPLGVCGSLVAKPTAGGGGLVAGSYRLGWRQGGERLRVNRQTRSLKRLLGGAAVPPWWRDKVPLLYGVPVHGVPARASSEQKVAAASGMTLAAVADLYVSSDFQSTPGLLGYTLHWQPAMVNAVEKKA